MQEVSRLVERVLNTTATVLLTGESGTGKELIARVLHYQGPRAKGPFIAVNCAAIPETLLEAELFGYERGAFTGATQRKPGRFELAAGGTLFLDEIGDMSAVLQAKLLRVLQAAASSSAWGGRKPSRPTPASSRRPIKIWISSSPRGDFARDLFYRLNVYPIALPPLRERQEDLGPLTMFFLKRYSQKLRRRCWASPRRRWVARALFLARQRPGAGERHRACGDPLSGTVVTPQELPSLREHPGHLSSAAMPSDCRPVALSCRS